MGAGANRDDPPPGGDSIAEATTVALRVAAKVGPAGDKSSLALSQVQATIRMMYGERDAARGATGTFLWLLEEVGELAGAVRKYQQAEADDPARGRLHAEMAAEFADVLAWLATVANIAEVSLTDAFLNKYGNQCPGCGNTPCGCQLSDKP